MQLCNLFGVMALIGASTALPYYSPSMNSGIYPALHFPSAGGNRYGTGYVGNPGIGIKQTDANLADLYGLPRQLAQSPAPRPLNAPAPLSPFAPHSPLGLAPAPLRLSDGYYQQAAAAVNLGYL